MLSQRYPTENQSNLSGLVVDSVPLANRDVTGQTDSHYFQARAKNRPETQLTSIGVPKIAEICSLVIT